MRCGGRTAVHAVRRRAAAPEPSRPRASPGLGVRGVRLQPAPDQRLARQCAASGAVPALSGAARHLDRRSGRAERRALGALRREDPRDDRQNEAADRGAGGRLDLRPGLIVTLHRGNATADKLPRMNEWFRRLDRIGIRSIRLHLLEVEDAATRTGYALSPKQNAEALLDFVELESRARAHRVRHRRRDRAASAGRRQPGVLRLAGL